MALDFSHTMPLTTVTASCAEAFTTNVTTPINGLPGEELPGATASGGLGPDGSNL